MIVGIKDLRIGDTPIAKVMVGDSLVWERVVRPYPAWVYEMGTPLEGIRTTTDSYLDTGYLPSVGSDYMYFEVQKGIDGNSYAWGNFEVGETANTIRFFNTSGYASISQFSASNVLQTQSLVADRNSKELLVIQIDKRSVNVNGLDISTQIEGDYLQSDKSIFIGSWYEGGYATLTNDFFGKLKAGASKDNLSVDYIPFQTKEGAVGMLNLINKEFKSSLGTGQFEAVSLETTITQLSAMGVTPTNDFTTNQQMLNELGVL